MLGGVDIRVACPDAKFAVMEPKRGLFAGGGTTVRLPRQVPWAQAMEFLLCADLIDAQRALRHGPAERDRSARPAPRQGLRVREPHDRQRAARRQGDEAERAAGSVPRRGHDEAAARRHPQAARDAADDRRRRARHRSHCGRKRRRHPRVARQGAPHRVREGEPALRARSSRPRTRGKDRRRSRRNGSPTGRADERGRPAQSVHHRCRQSHVASRRRRRRGRARAGRHVGRRGANRGNRFTRARRAPGRRQHQPRVLPDLPVRRPAGETRREARYLAAAPLLLGHRWHDDATARVRGRRSDSEPANATSS